MQEAEEFVATYDTTFTMLWDAGFESWANLGVSLQPSSILLGADGSLLGQWLGPIPEDAVLELVAGAAPVGQVGAASDRFCSYAARYVRAAEALAGVDGVALDDRQIVFDDIRFASNAMAQTAPVELAADVLAFAASNQALAAAAIDHAFDLDAARAETDYALLDDARRAATEQISGQVEAACDVALIARLPVANG